MLCYRVIMSNGGNDRNNENDDEHERRATCLWVNELQIVFGYRSQDVLISFFLSLLRYGGKGVSGSGSCMAMQRVDE